LFLNRSTAGTAEILRFAQDDRWLIVSHLLSRGTPLEAVIECCVARVRGFHPRLLNGFPFGERVSKPDQGWRRCGFSVHSGSTQHRASPCASLDLECNGVAARGLCGSAALSCGKALPFQAFPTQLLFFRRGCASPVEAEPPPRPGFKADAGKAKPFRKAERRSRCPDKSQ
jgi:hypothetical protein